MINIIVATSKNNQIGVNNKLPWYIPEDLNYFKTMTDGHVVLMGRKTFESIGKPLPNRTNVVLTRDTSFAHEGVTVVHTLEEALAFCSAQEQVFIIGGGEVYSLFLPYAETLYITKVDKIIDGDVNFPVYEDTFKLVASRPAENLTSDGHSLAFTTWHRK